MKKLIMITALFMCFVGSAQKKKSSKIIPPPPVKEVLEPPKMQELIIEDDRKNCFVYKNEEQKDSLIYVTETLLEYGWASDLARIIITTYDYDPVKKKEAEEAGYTLVQAETMQFIEGIFKIENSILTFTHDKLDRFKTQLFKINYKPKTKKVDFLTDENNNKLQTGECLQPMVSIGMR